MSRLLAIGPEVFAALPGLRVVTVHAAGIGPGDVVVNLPGTPHWLSQIDGSIEYFEIQIPNVDPAPGIERAEVKSKTAP